MKKWFLKNKSTLYWVVVSIIFVVLAYIQYYGLITYKYLVPQGDDPANHLAMIQPIYDHTQSIWEIIRRGDYPPGFHLFISSIAHFLNVTPLKTILWFYPSILVLTSLSVFILCYRVFGRWAALVALILYSFISRTPAQLLNDGGYPNLLAASFLLPIFIIFFLEVFQKKWWRKILGIFGSFLLAGLILFTHHLSSIYLIGIVSMSLPFLIIGAGISNRWKLKKWIVIAFFTLVFIYLLGLFFVKSEAFAPTRDLMKGMVELISSFPYLKIVGKADPYAFWPLNSYPYLIGKSVFLFGFLGVFLLPVFLWKKKKEYMYPYILLSIWTIILFIISRLGFLSNPERAARDLAAPLSILGGALIVQIILLPSESSLAKWIRYLYYLSLLLLLIFLSAPNFSERFEKEFQYEPMVRYTSADNSIVKYLNTQPSGSIIVGSLNYYVSNYLTGWDIHYLYGMTEEEKKLVFNPNNSYSRDFLKQFDYFYFVSNQSGWTPPVVRYDFIKEYVEIPDFELIMVEQSDTNEVLLYKVKK